MKLPQLPPNSVTQPSLLRPVRSDYEPSYPRKLTPEEIETLLRPGLIERFGHSTMLAGALVVGMLTSGGGCEKSSTATAGLPAKSTRTNAELKARVDGIVAEVLGKYDDDAGWNERTRLRLDERIASNPPVKTPAIPVSFGNSFIGIFDVEAAREATRRLFKEYGIELKANVAVKGDGYEFVADGYDEKNMVGFELIDADAKRVRFADQNVIPAPSAKLLEEKELPKLDGEVKAGKVRMFVANANEFPNMDGDLFTPMEYHLASVIDYLNWIHGDGQIERNKVLGKPPGAVRSGEPDRRGLFGGED